MTTVLPNLSGDKADHTARRPLLIAVIVIAAMTALRIAYACLIDLRTDEA